MNIQPLHLLLSALAALINREQSRVIEYLLAENRILRARVSRSCIKFTDGDRCSLAQKSKGISRRILNEIGTLVTPDTLLRWHRELIACKYDGSKKRTVGRPSVMADIKRLIIRMATENPSWGYTRIQGALLNVGHTVGRSTIARALKVHGIDPSKQRGRAMTWKTFLKAHWTIISAADMFTVEVWIRRTLIRYHVLFAIELSTRRVAILGIVPEPYSEWMAQIARNATDAMSGCLVGKEYLIIDRDSRFTNEFCDILSTAGVQVLRLPPRSPNLNAFAERFVRSIKEECLGKLILFSEGQLRTAVGEYMKHYHGERNHQGLANRLIDQFAMPTCLDTPVARCERLGGLLGYYRRAA